MRFSEPRCANTGDLPAARASLQRAIALLPPTAAVYVDLGITYLRAGELDKALGQLEAGLNLPSPSVPTPDWDAAIAGLRQALAAEPGAGAEAHNVLGLPARPQGRRQQPRWRRSSAKPFGCGRTSPKPTTISVSC